MIRAAGGIPGDSFLVRQILREEMMEMEDDNDGGKLQVLYFLKVIELFQQFGYYDFVIELAKTALDICDAEDPNRVRNN